MTTQELILWCNQAQAIQEQSWDGTVYSLTLRETTQKTRPPTALDFEEDMVFCLNYRLWNEVQDWVKESKTNPHDSTSKPVPTPTEFDLAVGLIQAQAGLHADDTFSAFEGIVVSEANSHDRTPEPTHMNQDQIKDIILKNSGFDVEDYLAYLDQLSKDNAANGKEATGADYAVMRTIISLLVSEPDVKGSAHPTEGDVIGREVTLRYSND